MYWKAFRFHLPENARCLGIERLLAALRKRFGIKAEGVLVVEDRKGELVLRPAAVVELDTYTDEEIARWEREDRLSPGERSRIVKKLGRKR